MEPILKRRLIFVLFVLALLTPAQAISNDGNKEKASPNDLATVALLAGGAVFFSYAAAEEPHWAGVTYLCVPPYFLMAGHPRPGQKMTSNWNWRMAPFLGAFLAAGIYNLNTDEDDYSKSEVFETNLWIFGVGELATYLLMSPTYGKSEKEESDDLPEIGLHYGPGEVGASVTFRF